MMDSFTQTNGMEEANSTDLDLDTEPLVVGGMDFGTSDFYDAYRDGNFGIKRGRINFSRARKCSVVHLIVAVLVVVVSITLVCLVEANRYSIYHEARDAFKGLSISCGIIALATSCCSLYLVKYITTMKRPLFVLLLTRLLAFLECLLAVSTFVTTIVAVSESSGTKSWYDYHTVEPILKIEKVDNFILFVFLCVLLVLLLLLDIVATMAWLFHWWRCCDCCQQLKSCCIFEPGQPLAEGVPDPRTGFLKECMYVCWATYRSDWGTII